MLSLLKSAVCLWLQNGRSLRFELAGASPAEPIARSGAELALVEVGTAVAAEVAEVGQIAAGGDDDDDDEPHGDDGVVEQTGAADA